MKRAMSIAAAGLISLSSLCAATAQTQSKQPPMKSDPCQASPETDSGTPRKDGSEDLSRCKGVLKPPSSTDDKMEKAPPQQGEMPVIRPDQLPPKQQPQ